MAPATSELDLLARRDARADRLFRLSVAAAGFFVLAGLVGAALTMAILIAFPQAMFPNSAITGLEWLLPVTVIALAWSDVMLAA